MQKITAFLLGASLLAGCAMAGDEDPGDELDPRVHELDVKPTGNGTGIFNKFQQGDAKPSGGGGGRTNGISYHGGPVMGVDNGVSVYLIFYGNWSSRPADTNLIQSFASSLGGSAYYNINTSYTDGTGAHIQNIVRLGGTTFDNYSLGASHTNLSDTDIQSIVSFAIDNQTFPVDPQAVYFVLTSSDLTQTKASGSAFCTSFCGWHQHFSHAGADVKYSFVGDPARCPTSCEAQATGPNGTQSADGMVSIIAHELEEANTDPDLNAWYDRRGYENADKCAWTFGTQSTAANGAKYNMTVGGNNYLVQQNWVNAAGGYCAMSY